MNCGEKFVFRKFSDSTPFKESGDKCDSQIFMENGDFVENTFEKCLKMQYDSQIFMENCDFGKYTFEKSLEMVCSFLNITSKIL